MFKKSTSPEAKDAVRWFLRTKVATDVQGGLKTGTDALIAAGKHKIEWFRGPADQDRLDDKAIAKLVGTTFFAGYSVAAQNEIESQLGMSYEDSLKA